MSTGGRVFPSATGGGLTRAGEAIFNAVLARRQRELQERQLGQQDRVIAIQERTAALNRFNALAGFLEPGTKLGELGSTGMKMFQDAFQMPTEGLEDLELNPETIQTALAERGIPFIRETSDEDLLPSLRDMAGLEPDADVAALRNLEARIRSEALTEIVEDPDLKSEFVSRALGREPITLTIPGFDGSPDTQISFDSPTAANIYAQFLLSRERFSLELDLQNEEMSNALVEEIQGAVAEAGQSVSSTALAGRVLPTYNRAVESGDLSVVTSYLANPGTSEGERLAMTYLLGSIQAGEQTFLDELEQTAPRLAAFLRVSGAVREAIPTAEMAAEILPGITQALSEIGVPSLRDPWGFGGLRVEFGEEGLGSPGTSQVSGLLPELGNVPRNFLIDAAEDLLSQGEEVITRAEIVASLGEDIVAAAEGRTGTTRPGAEPTADPAAPPSASFPQGGFDPAQVPAGMRTKVNQLNTLLRRRAEAEQRGVSQPRAEAAIQRLQGEIQTAIQEEGQRDEARGTFDDARIGVDAVTLAEAEGDIPAGGINPSSLPDFVASDVQQLNTLVRRRNKASAGQQAILDRRIEALRDKIARAIEER